MNGSDAICDRLRALLRDPDDWPEMEGLIRRHHAARHADEAWHDATQLADIGRLVAGIAHEINNPAHIIATDLAVIGRALPSLRAIVDEFVNDNGAVSIAGMPWPAAGERLSQLVNDATSGVERIRRIVHELLHHACPDAHDKRQNLDLNRIVMAALDLAGSDLRLAGHDCHVDLQPLLPTVRGYPQRLQQVLLNLIGNARQSLGSRTGRIGVHTWHEDDRVHCRITDDGPGMNAATLARAEEPFFTTRKESGGNGLGLWICRRLIDEHDGALHIDTAPDRGCRVTFSLPTAD